MIQVVLITRTGKAYFANGIAAFTLDKEAYTPYSQLTATVYGNFSIQQFAGIYRVQLLLDGTELHFGKSSGWCRKTAPPMCGFPPAD